MSDDERAFASVCSAGVCGFQVLAWLTPESHPEIREWLLARSAELAQMGGPTPLRVYAQFQERRFGP